MIHKSQKNRLQVDVSRDLAQSYQKEACSCLFFWNSYQNQQEPVGLKRLSSTQSLKNIKKLSQSTLNLASKCSIKSLKRKDDILRDFNKISSNKNKQKQKNLHYKNLESSSRLQNLYSSTQNNISYNMLKKVKSYQNLNFSDLNKNQDQIRKKRQDLCSTQASLKMFDQDSIQNSVPVTTILVKKSFSQQHSLKSPKSLTLKPKTVSNYVFKEKTLLHTIIQNQQKSSIISPMESQAKQCDQRKDQNINTVESLRNSKKQINDINQLPQQISLGQLFKSPKKKFKDFNIKRTNSIRDIDQDLQQSVILNKNRDKNNFLSRLIQENNPQCQISQNLFESIIQTAKV